jgi:hypothetical protein
MNTTAAALQANVTTATIRTWCRRGVITAAKQAGRWIIDTASLAARITIGAMRTRKAPMSQPQESVEVRVDDHTTIRAHHETRYGPACWYAHKYINGWKAGTIPTTGDTADEAITAMQELLAARQAEDAKLAAFEDAGLIDDLTATHTPGIYSQLDTLTVRPRRARDGECLTCGLNARTCDCR